MENNNEHLETLNQIKGLMERSTKLISLSGMSGIAAGLVATIGAVTASIYLHTGFFEQTKNIMIIGKDHSNPGLSFLFILTIIVFLLSLSLALYFSSLNAKKKELIFWDSVAKRVFINHFIFMLTGGIFCLILLYYGINFLIVASMLIFYGLALINISKFTFNIIAQLGIIEICLGIFSSFVTVYPLLLWLIGFGIMHLIYGFYVYFKYERS